MVNSQPNHDRAQLKSQLIYEFGLYLAPLEELARRSSPPSINELRLAFAQHNEDDRLWHSKVGKFIQEGNFPFVPPNLGSFIGTISDAWYDFEQGLFSTTRPINLERLHGQLQKIVVAKRSVFFARLGMVPLEWEAKTYEAKTPFTVYMRIKDALAAVRKRVHYFDRYLRDDFFPLYLRNLDRSLEIRVITTKGEASYGIDNVKQVSDMARQEFTDYQLVEVTPKVLHDRNLRVDDQVFVLGSGVPHGGKYPTYPTTFAPGDGTTHGLAVLESIISQGKIIHQS